MSAAHVAARLKGRGREDRDGGCLRCASWMTPCIYRDGSLALDDRGECVGCGMTPQQAKAEDKVVSECSGS